jgi:predicted SprT family Zn-dependent metalloprotease
MHLSPAMLESAYAYLLTTPPFNRWKLPHPDDVIFTVTRDKATAGRCIHRSDGTHEIRMSQLFHYRTHAVMETMSHEMVHMYCDRRGVRAHHGKEFKRCAARVCKEHGFDDRLF